MSTIIHLADLHISAAETEYSLAVLDEILDLAGREKIDFLFMAGDIFDSFADAYKLRKEFREQINSLEPKIEVFYLPGNHEALQTSGVELNKLDFGNIHLLEGKPCTLLEREDIELLAIPHQEAYQEYREWSVPPKRPGKTRLSLAHTNIAGMSFAGFEEGGAVMDTDLFEFHQVDYAALGHIHTPRELHANGTLLSYPGSARVWRRGESGPHGVNLVRTGQTVRRDFLPLERAGEYREYRVPLNFEGIPLWDEETARMWGSHDWVELNLTGIVEDEHQVRRQVERLQEACAPRLRRLKINREGVTVFSGISSHPVARQFINLWQSRNPGTGAGEEHEIWLEAREMGLWEIKKMLEARE